MEPYGYDIVWRDVIKRSIMLITLSYMFLLEVMMFM